MSRANTTDLVGAVVLVEKDHPNLLLSDKTLRLVPKRNVLHAPFLLYALRTASARAHIEQSATGTSFSMRNISQEKIAATPIPLPPIADQRRIAALLDKAIALRAKRLTGLAELDALSKSIFLDLFGDPGTNPKGWPVRSIGELCEVKGGKRLPKGEEYSRTPTPFRYIRVTDLKQGAVDESGLVYLKPEVQSKIARYVVNAGDVIISIAGSIGLTAPVPASLAGVNLTENAAKLVPRDRSTYNAEYLAHVLQAPAIQGQIGSNVGQVTIGKLALFRVEKVAIPLPPIDLQRDFVRRIGAVRKLKAIQVTALAQLDALFATLQHLAFRGEV
ncbi:MAG TPA: restriction endonuclease subunit S [Burkholderiales bacterium]|nr:restriction endonuclease subunit S [Burkholderiales bacterium]